MAQPSDLPKKNLQAANQASVDASLEGAALPDIQNEPSPDDDAAAFEQLDQSEEAPAVDEAIGGPAEEDIKAFEAAYDQDDSELREALDLDESFDLDDPQAMLEEKKKNLPMKDEIYARIAGAIASSPEQRVSMTQRSLGDKFNVKSVGDKVKIQLKGSKKWIDIDNEGFDGGLREVVSDVFADNAEVFTEIAAGIPAEAASIGAGMVAGTVMGGFPVGTAIGGLVGHFAIGAPAAATASQKARELALKAYGESYEGDAGDAILLGTAGNMFGLGAGALISKGAKEGAKFIKSRLEASPKKFLENLAEIRQSFEQFVDVTLRRESGALKGFTKAQDETAEKLLGEKAVENLSKEEAGERFIGAVAKEDARLKDSLELLRDDVISRTGDKRFPADRFADGLKDYLGRLGATPQEIALISSGAGSQAGASAGTLMKKMRRELMNRAERASAGGDGDAAATAVGKIFDEFEYINQKGGLTAQEMLDKAQDWKKPSGISQRTKQPVKFPNVFNKQSASVQQGLSADELDLFTDVYGQGSLKASLIQKSKNEFADKIDGIREFQDIFKKRKNAERFTEAVITNGRPDLIYAMKEIVGENSDEFQIMKNEWLKGLYDKAIDPKTGIVKTEVFQKSLDDLGEASTKALLSQKELQTLQFLNKRAQKMPMLKDGTAGADQASRDLIAVAAGYKNPAAIARIIWNVTRSNADVAKTLAEGGLLKIAVQMKKPEVRGNLFEAYHLFKSMVDSSYERAGVKLPDGNHVKMLVPIEDELDVLRRFNKNIPSNATLRKQEAAVGDLPQKRVKVPMKAIAAGSAISESFEGEPQAKEN